MHGGRGGNASYVVVIIGAGNSGKDGGNGGNGAPGIQGIDDTFCGYGGTYGRGNVGGIPERNIYGTPGSYGRIGTNGKACDSKVFSRGKIYYLAAFNNSKKYQDAEEIADNCGGKLVSIHNQLTQDIVSELVQFFGYDCWIGCERREGTTIYDWADETAIKIENGETTYLNDNTTFANWKADVLEGSYSDANRFVALCADDGKWELYNSPNTVAFGYVFVIDSE